MFFDTEVLPTEINSGYTDFSPTALGNDTIYFASLRKDSIVKYKHGEDAIFNINIYESVRSEDNTWSTAEIKSELSEEFDHVANGVFGPNNKFYYTKCYQDPHNEFICSIYSRKILDNGQLDKHEHKLPGKINKNHYTSTQPTFGRFYKRKGKAKIWYDVMYYATNRPGGYGGMDIWYSVIDNGKFSAPVNCKKSVNTIRDEITPFYNQAEQKLYFSSNYRYGLGGFDIFSSEGKLKRFRQTENLGMPFNSSYDDTYFVPTLDTVNATNIGYLVSNRPGGFALASETCCDDIYRFESYIPDSVTIDILLTELVLTPDSTSNITASTDSNFVATSKVEKIGSIGMSGARVGYMKKYKYDKMMKEDSTLTATAFDALVTWVDTTSAEGKTKTSFLADKDYVILIEKEGFKDTIIDLSLIHI